ncbi:methyltransferase domain-containing protein [Gammaproteobacteria bacterium]|nr:methyltransferase domain-containing protein [Gammaproteobacteria bacterium]MDB2356936.1 methyltransferase domain-containing protein [Gammaproteobacteria bacterium]
MNNMYKILGLLIFTLGLPQTSEAADHKDALLDAVNNAERNPQYSARDQYRNPYKTLSFFQIEPTMQVLELSAGGGWYTEILAPYLKSAGKLSVTHHNPQAGGYYKRSREAYDKKVNSNPLFAGVQVITADVPPTKPFTKPETQDLVVTFRNLHNWLGQDAMQAMMQEAYNALKEGGHFGVVEHRAPEGSSLEFMKKSGYVTQSLAIKTAQEVGFRLVASSEINANPRDTADHPKGVWTLPPSFRLKDQDRAKYAAIGESDRMTLLFKK